MALINKKESVVRIPKQQVDSISTNRLFYYVDIVKNESNENKVVFGLVNNLKGKKKIKEFDSIKKLQREVNKIVNK